MPNNILPIKPPLFFILACIIWCSCSNEASTKTLKLAHGLNQNHPIHQGFVHLQKQLETISNGQMTIEIYANQQLGGETERLELAQLGSIDLVQVPAGIIENFIPEFKVLGIPYLFKSKSYLFETLDGKIGENLLQSGQHLKLKGLAFYDAGSRSFYSTNTPIESPSDLNGKKIRTMESPMAIEMIATMGGSAIPITYGELYTALQTNMVNGAENNPTSFYSSKHYEICKYYVLDEHTSIPDVLFIGTSNWNKLSSQEKKWLTLAVKQSVIYQRELWRKNDEEALNNLKNEGVSVIYPNKERFQQAVNPMLEKYKKDPIIGTYVKEILAN